MQIRLIKGSLEQAADMDCAEKNDTEYINDINLQRPMTKPNVENIFNPLEVGQKGSN